MKHCQWTNTECIKGCSPNGCSAAFEIDNTPGATLTDSERFETRVVLYRLVKVFENCFQNPAQQKAIEQANYVLNKYNQLADVLR